MSVPEQNEAIMAAAAGRELTRTQIITVLIDAGSSPGSANGKLSITHPLFTHVGPERYRLINLSTGEVAGTGVEGG